VFSTKIVGHGGRRGNTMQALARWRHSVASREALDVLHQAMCPALRRRNCMATEFARNLPAFFVVLHLLFAHTVS
jgi:hypothetical protein